MPEPYKLIDSSPLLNFLFYPRRYHNNPPDGAFDLQVPINNEVEIVCRAYQGTMENPWILYFHGNGEVVSDYDAIAPLYRDRGLNLLVADYRGYGASTGRPTFSAMIGDAVKIINFLYDDDQFREKVPEAKWLVMGRSLGSVSALELASRFPERIKGLIIESGFISVHDLINHLGLPIAGDLSPLEEYCRNLTAGINLPSLVIHGQYDNLVPLEQGRDLYETLGSHEKEFVVIPGADHNNIMFVNPHKYMNAIAEFCLIK